MDIKNGDFKVGCSHEVDVTHINDPHSFFVRPINLEVLMNLIEKPSRNPIPAEKIKLGQLVVYRSTILGKYVRGNIRFIKIDGQNVKCDIYAMDYGCFEKSVVLGYIHYPDISSEPENRCPGMAVHCRLYLCEPKDKGFTKEVIDAMKFFVGKHAATITVIRKMNDQLVVELTTVDCPKDVAMMMALLHYTTLTKGACTVNRFYTSPASASLNLTKTISYKHKKFNVGDTLYVRVQSGTEVSGFYVAEVNEFKTLISDEPTFSLYCKSRHMRDEDIVPGRPCGVKLDNLDKYERAIIKKIIEPNSKAVLQLVDWGKEIVSPFSCIRSVVSEIYFTKPILAIYCSTDEDQIWETGMPRFLFPGYALVIKIMELGSGFDKPHKVNIYPLEGFTWVNNVVK